MIPWRLTFSGIRDYPPTLLDLSGADEHVMITGPNGAGKSTITFCMGAVLYSSKVDIEGLKSRNLPVDQTWKAKVSLLFHNEGMMKIDAPAFIEFTLKITQDPGQPMKKEFSIAAGDVIDEWEYTDRYTSGDKVFSFSTYKKDLQYKYKVDPDLYYLIWYQQEVNQFAVMNPEERFRIFSEMHGIDKVQRDWEESMEKVKDTEETLRSAETNVKLMKQELSMKKSALDRFIDNQNRLSDGGQLYILSLLQLETYYKIEKERLGAVILQLEDDLEEAKDDVALKISLKERKITELEETKLSLRHLDEKYEASIEIRQNIDDKITLLQEQIDELDQELASITQRKNQISRTEAEVKTALEKLIISETQTNNELEQIQQSLKDQKALQQKNVEEIARLKLEVEHDEQAHRLHFERLNQYQSSHAVQSTIEHLNTKVVEKKNTQFEKKQKEKALEEELELLEENRDLSVRQLESLKFFRTQQIKAYALRELLELDEEASIKAEQLFNAIKYTMFFDGKHATPPNDLYHVPLMAIVPDRMVNHLPTLHLKVRNDLVEKELAFAMKALWWVEQFFKEGAVSIKNGILIDSKGLRGPQEKNRYILSVKALMARKLEVQKSLEVLRHQLSVLEQDIDRETKRFQELNSIIHQVKESEAFMTNEYERILRKKKLIEANVEKEAIKAEIQKLESEKSILDRQQLKQEQQRETLENEASFYVELGKLKDKYEKRNELHTELDEQKAALKHQLTAIEKMEDGLDLLKRTITRLTRDCEHMDDAIESQQGKLDSIKRQRTSGIEDQDVAKQELVQIIKELEDMKHMIPDLYKRVSMDNTFEKLPSVKLIKQACENGRVKFEHARNESGIDPAAPENYQTVKQEYERLDDDYKRTKILLDQDKERMEGLKDQLETTINMRVLELQQRFKSYMGQFQFEGDISWESYEDRRNRTHFNLYIKARKEGHRGTMEDVSTKARGGRVGKGVSGGEESLSSLLFALALLQNLQTTPGFIVLDEFDSALDENRKVKVFDLYVLELQRKLIILTPKSHEETYLNKFSKAFVVQHDPTVPKSKVVGIIKKA
ncbi:chromosome segregation protein SMC [Bacillus marasmi]|uniref:chromosome segregation protein SMC n=1 Tax=Bacillus marasmi TaxID=1926279 RepID=UPI0011C7BE6E|nr:chromosome segregation protein SMC [Bacillus marasmi]